MRSAALRAPLSLVAAVAGGTLLGWLVAGRVERPVPAQRPAAPANALSVPPMPPTPPAPPAPPAPDVATVARARALTRRLVVVDTHIDLPYRLHDQPVAERRRPRRADREGRLRLSARGRGRARRRLDVDLRPGLLPEGAVARRLCADGLIDLVEGIAREAPGEVRDGAERRRRRGGDRARAGSRCRWASRTAPRIEDDLANVRHFFDRGVRYITLTHGEDNLIGDSSYSSPTSADAGTASRRSAARWSRR